MHSSEKWLEFYRKLGFLFYSVAASDKRITSSEIEMLKKELRENWLDVEDSRDDFDTDAAYQVEAIFDWLQEEAPSSWDAFGEFEAFIDENPDFVNMELKVRIMKTADQITTAFSGRNKAELTILQQLNRLLNISQSAGAYHSPDNL
ncbi:TerB family tellurite resistance protein [Sphingobacterium olei]|uniref:TerB family tellurite resistance protein n=1 Tax=Sphingobacterium olei TaxID=2571155 RepID=A0A4U0NYU3_9SPHI|nr:TerB family tellurite resistance protein [Sphingobacterium olei]TJZ60047.1 TerB family tellurite resistance protein [Sphingobacterium olei]